MVASLLYAVFVVSLVRLFYLFSAPDICRCRHTRNQKPAPERWIKFMAQVSGACVMALKSGQG